jgi:hypothetical protein
VVPAAAIVAPIICAVLDRFSQAWFNGYEFGFEILLLNAAFTIFGLLVFSRKSTTRRTLER